jgi:hypothetical protein
VPQCSGTSKRPRASAFAATIQLATAHRTRCELRNLAEGR